MFCGAAMAVALLGAGCNAQDQEVQKNDSAALTGAKSDYVLDCPPPTSANPPINKVRIGPVVKSPEIRSKIATALQQNTDFVALRSEWEQLVGPFAPRDEDYITAIDEDGGNLTGLSVSDYNESLRKRVTLVALHPSILTNPNESLKYLYMNEVYLSGATSSALYWFESGKAGRCETVLPIRNDE